MARTQENLIHAFLRKKLNERAQASGHTPVPAHTLRGKDIADAAKLRVTKETPKP